MTSPRQTELNSPIEIRFFLLNINRVEGIQSEPSGEGEAGLVRPLGQRRNHHGRTSLPGETEENIRARPDTDLSSFSSQTLEQNVPPQTSIQCNASALHVMNALPFLLASQRILICLLLMNSDWLWIAQDETSNNSPS